MLISSDGALYKCDQTDIAETDTSFRSISRDQITFTFPRSDVDPEVGAATLATGDDTKLTKDAETKVISTENPGKGVTYTTTAPLAILRADPASLGAGETVTGITLKANNSTANTYAVTEDSGAYYLTSSEIASEEATSVDVTLAVDGPDGETAGTPAYTYTRDINVAIPKVLLPAATLDTTAGTYVLKSGETKNISDALATLLPTGWRMMTAADESMVTGFTALTDAAVASNGGDNSDGKYTVPVFFDGTTEYRDTAVNFELTVVDGPGQQTITNLILAEKVKKDTVSLLFEDATNTEWEYKLTAEKQTGEEAATAAAPETSLDNWIAGSADGVKITGLTPGTPYYMNVRVADTPDSAIYGEDPVSTVYDLRVESAVKADGTSTLKTEDDGSVSVYCATEALLSAANEDDYVQTITLKNNNGSDVYDVDVQLEGVTPADSLTLGTITYSGDSSAATFKQNDSITILVHPNGTSAQLGENTATLRITAKGTAGGTQVVNRTVPIKLVVYGGRGGTQPTPAVTFRANDSSDTDTSVTKAAVGAEVALSAEWTDSEGTAHQPDSYKVLPEGTTDFEVTGDATNGFKLKVNTEKNLADIGDTGVKVQAVYNRSAEGSGAYFVEETVDIPVYIKGILADVVGDDSIDLTIGAGATGDLTYGIDGVTAALDGTDYDGITVDASYQVTTADGATGGKETYTLTLADDTDEYSAGTASVTVYALNEMTNMTLETANLKKDDTTATVDLTVSKDGTTYTADKYELKKEPDGTPSEITVTDPAAYAMDTSVTGKYTITATVPASYDTYSSAFTATKMVYVRQAAVFTGDKEVDLDNTAGNATVSVAQTTGDPAATVSYAILDGKTIGSIGADGTFTANGTATGKVTVQVTATQTDDQESGSDTVIINVQGEPDGGDPAEDVPPVHGTGADILGETGTETPTYPVYSGYEGFNAKSEGSEENDHWSGDGANMMIFSNLTQGVAYQVRYATVDQKTTWQPVTGSDADGWFDIGNEDLSPDLAHTGKFAYHFGPLVGAAYTAEIRYKDDGTVGDTVVDEDPVKFTIHHLVQGVSYEYRVLKDDGTPGSDWTPETEDGWSKVPAYVAPGDYTAENGGTQAEAGSDPAMYSYSFIYTGDGTKVETRYANTPVIKKVGDDYVISGLIPGANYDLQSLSLPNPPGFVDDDPDTTEVNEQNYMVKTATPAGTDDPNGPGTITIKFSEEATSDFVVLEVEVNKGVRIRQSATSGTLPSDPTEPKAGVTVSGVVFAYAARREGVVSLYPYNEDGTEPEYFDATASGRPLLDTPYTATFGGEDEVQSSGQSALHFSIEMVPEGTYLLVVKKPGNAHFVVKNIVVGGTDVDLTDTETFISDVNSMTLVAGDIDGNGSVESADAETVYLPANWGSSNPEIVECDLDGNGSVESADVETIFLPVNWNQGDVFINSPYANS